MSYRSSKAVDESIRKLKVHRASFATGSTYRKRYKYHPSILIKGIYLVDYGFNIGDVIEVEMVKGKIIITKASH
jgi:hypothetical protein